MRPALIKKNFGIMEGLTGRKSILIESLKMSLPIISINETERKNIEISRDIGKSCERFGFFIIKDHNLKISTIENARNLSKQFFS